MIIMSSRDCILFSVVMSIDIILCIGITVVGTYTILRNFWNYLFVGWASR